MEICRLNCLLYPIIELYSYLHYLNKYKIMGVRLTSKFDMRRLCRTIGAQAQGIFELDVVLLSLQDQLDGNNYNICIVVTRVNVRVQMILHRQITTLRLTD